jgi:ATP synthase protein I
MHKVKGFLRPCFIAAGIAAVIAAVIGGITAGGTGSWAAPAGVALAALGFAGSAAAVAFAETFDLRLTLPMALITYSVKLALVMTILSIVKTVLPDALLPFAYGVVGGAVVWLATQVVWAYRAKIPYIELDSRS